MLAGEPDAAGGHAGAVAHSLDVGVAALQAGLEIAVGPVTGQGVSEPVGGVAGDGDAGGRGGVVVGEAGEVGREEGG
jgi:hypothetical protein